MIFLMEIKQKPYNMLCTIIYFIFSSIYSLLMLREATFLNRYYWKMTQISAILWYFWSIWAFYSPKEISMTLIWPSLMLKIKSYYLVWLAIPESLAERLTLSAQFTHEVNLSMLSTLLESVQNPLFHLFWGQTMSISHHFGQNTIFALFSQKFR